MFEGWLTIAVFLPIAAAVLIALFGRNAVMVKWFAAIVSLVELVLTFVIFLLYDTSHGAAQYHLAKHTQHLSLIHISEPTRPY